MTTLTWAAATNGYWSSTTSSGWTGGANPSSTSVLYVKPFGGNTSAYTITVAKSGGTGGSEVGGSLTMSDAYATLQSAATYNLTIGTAVSLSAGTIDLTTASKFQLGSLSVSGGSIDQTTGTFSVTGLASFTGGSNTVAGGIFNGGTVQVSDSGTHGTYLNVNGGTVTSTAQASIASGDTLGMGGGSLVSTGAGVSDAGAIDGHGVITTGSSSSTDLEGSGSVIAMGGTLEITSADQNGGTTGFTVDANSTLQFDKAVGSSGSVSFNNGGTAEFLSLGTAPANNFGATVHDFSVGDTIVVTGATGYTLNVAGTVLTVTDNSGATTLATINLAESHTGLILESGADFTTNYPCFAAGTLIETDRGEVAVEDLVEGDLVVALANGEPTLKPVVWIGHRRINLAAHPHPQTAAPVRLRRGAIGENLPQRDLLLSPDHCVFLDGKLIPAKLLINGMTITQERHGRAVHYYHVELEHHGVLLAEGLPVESYLDTGNRAYFLNSGMELVLHPEFSITAGLKTWQTHACAPLTLDAETVKPVWQALVARAEAIGYQPPEYATTEDPALRLKVGEQTFAPVSAVGGRYVFVLPARTTAARIVSRAAIPSDLQPYLDDWRPLGVAIRQIVVKSAAQQAVIPADHPELERGWYRCESDGASNWRWTDGNAEIPITAEGGPVTVELELCNRMTYVVGAAETKQRLAA